MQRCFFTKTGVFARVEKISPGHRAPIWLVFSVVFLLLSNPVGASRNLGPPNQPSQTGRDPKPVLIAQGPDTIIDFLPLASRVSLGKVYEKPSKTSPVITELTGGERFRIIYAEGPWYVLRLSDGTLGWAEKSAFQKNRTEDQSRAERISRQNQDPNRLALSIAPAGLRKTPDPKIEPFHSLTHPQNLTLLDTKDNWRKVATADDQSGWLHANYFTKNEGSDDAGIQITAIGSGVGQSEKEFVKIALSHSAQPEIFEIYGEKPRIVIDFFAASIHRDIRQEIPLNGILIKGLRQWAYGKNEKKVRIVLDLVPSAHYLVHHIFYVQNNLFVLSLQEK